MNTYKRYLFFTLAILFVLLLAWGGISVRKQFKHYESQMLKFELKEQVFTKQTDEQGRQIIQQEQIILTQKQAIKHGLLEIDRLSKVKSQVKIVSRTKLDSVFVPFTLTETDSIFISDTINAISVPKEFKLSDKWYSLAGTINKRGVLMDSISFVNDMRISIGYKKQKLIKRVFASPIPIVDVQNENPHTEIIGLNNIVIQENKKFYNKKAFWFGAGFVGGIFLIGQVK